MAPRPARDRALLAAFVLSGAAALGYELLWTRLLAHALGHETLGMLGVLAGFFGGMALGAALLHERARSCRDPVGLFARLELVAAAFALVSPYLLGALAREIPPLLGPVAGDNDSPAALLATVALAATVLLPGTFCMGATLPALVEARRRALPDDDDGRGLGRLYAANTLGAVLGVWLVVHALLPRVGIPLTAALLAAMGVAAAALALRWRRRVDVPAAPFASMTTRVDMRFDPDAGLMQEPWLLHALAFGTGLVGVGLEVVGVQVLAQVLSNTVFTFAAVLAVYLLGTALGAAIYARVSTLARSGRPATVLAALLIALGLSVPLAAAGVVASGDLVAAWAPSDASYLTRTMAEGAAAALVFVVPTILMGVTFAHLVGLLAGSGVGRAYALNTLGGAVAPFLFGLVAIERYGYTDAFYVVAYAYAGLFLLFAWFRRFGTFAQLGGLALVVGATALGPTSLVLVEPDPQWRELERHETVMGLVLVSEHTGRHDPPLRRLQVGRTFRMGGVLAFGERRMGHIPLLLHPAPKRALYLGVGTGATMGAVTHEPDLAADGVELVPAVLETLHDFSDINGDLPSAPRVKLHAADARRFLAASPERYDVIVADLFHPARDGAGSLYALEHFEAARDHLREGGLFTQWLPLHQLDPADLAVVVRTFLDVFPTAQAFLGIYNAQTPALALVGGDVELAPERWATRLAAPVYRELLMQDPRDLLAARVLSTEGLRTLADGAARNTDLDPRITLDAPRRPNHGDRSLRNLALILALRAPPSAEELDASTPGEWAREGARFSDALAAYLRAELLRVAAGEGAPPPPAAVDALLDAYELAPDFIPARGMLLQLARQDPAIADRVLPLMLARTPDEPRIYQVYLSHLQRAQDPDGVRLLQELARTHLPQGG